MVLVGLPALVAAAIWLMPAIDLGALSSTAARAAADPSSILLAFGTYATAFVVRAWIWTRVLPSLGFGHALSALHVSLLGNHVLPFRLGEALRVTSVVRRARIPLSTATASTVMLRAADVLAVVTLAAALGPRLMTDLVGDLSWLVLAGAIGLWVAGLLWLRKIRADRGSQMRISSVTVGLGAVVGWLLESVLVHQAAAWAGITLSAQEAVLVTAVTIAAQTVAIAPGGIGTYEAAATAALVALGADAATAFAAAVGAHAAKTAYSLVTGAVAMVTPSPTAFGRLRMPKPAVEVTTGVTPPPEAPVVLFMPAHNEEASVGDVVRRVPSQVSGRPVRCLVIDDGSTDATAAEARRAGAEVISLSDNKGLGNAVRVGLAHSVAQGAGAVAFCDADGEYAPEELGVLVAPILEGRADYVVGSRFDGDIRHMRPHRRVGNIVLTRWVSFVARRKISDGQSGYRAFSANAASAAEVIHDFNYAQVLTLDLLAKGFRYAEVPITYSFRSTGRSFIKLGRYLRHVIPAVHREINSEDELRREEFATS